MYMLFELVSYEALQQELRRPNPNSSGLGQMCGLPGLWPLCFALFTVLVSRKEFSKSRVMASGVTQSLKVHLLVIFVGLALRATIFINIYKHSTPSLSFSFSVGLRGKDKNAEE